MSRKARHVRGKRARPRRPLRRAVTLTAAALASASVAGAALALSRSVVAGHAPARREVPASVARAGAGHAARSWAARARYHQFSGPGGRETSALTQAERRACPAAASACVDLKAHLAWLQSGRTVTYGPVPIEPGTPGTPDATPRGAFAVEWKGGPDLVSNEYHEPMPWATFFAPGGVAFHVGSLTQPSHGCVHLTIAAARYFQDHLPLGAGVVVF